MTETLFTIVDSDILQIKDRHGVSRLFKKLAYNVEEDLHMPFGNLELPGRLRDFIQNDGRGVYLLSNYDHLFQIYLFETNNLNLTPIKDVCQSFAKKQGDYLFLFTTDYSDIVFVNPLRRPGGVELRRIKVNTQRKPFHTELEVLNALALPAADMNPFGIYDLHCSAFQKERVTDEFYKAYKQVFEDVRQTLGDIRSSAQAHAFTQLLMNRMMLLYFVQKRGWLDGNIDFLKDFYEIYRQEETRGGSFYRDFLEPLFFRAFNRENGFEDLTVPDPVRQIFTNAPYLNGGMFVRLEGIESSNPDVQDAAFELLFERLFERYNFTVREDTPLDIELAIDPELLGNVYQRIIGEEERGLAGLFYTQPTEVNFMCERALIEYLSLHIHGKRSEITRLIMNYLDPPDDMDIPWDRVEKCLADVKICDVACGSGAFLVAMLHLLVDLRTLIRKKLDLTTDTFQLKKEIISKNLYGADVKAHAVRIAELRLWLSLVVDAPDDFIEKNPNDPLLPNLSYRLRQGDSLTEEFAGVPLRLRGEFDATSKRIPQIIQKIFDLENKIFNGTVKSSDLAEIKSEHTKLEKELLQGILKDRMESVRAQIRALKRQIEKPPGIQQGLFGTEAEQIQLDFEKTFRRETEKKIAVLEETLAEYGGLLESEDFGKLSERDYVLWEIDFAEVFMSKGGFDIIIGNPPYVRQEEIGPPTIIDRPTTSEERKAYKEKLIRSVQAFLSRDVRIDRKSDLYVYFYYLGMSLLNKKGVFVFITSNSWLDVGYGAGLQEWLLHNMEVKDIYDNQAKRSFTSADVNTVIVVFNKPEGDPLSHTVRFTAFRKPFEEVLSSDTLLAIDEAEGIVSTDDFRVYQITQEDLLEEGLEKDKTLDGMGKAAALVGTYKGNKWGGKYLRAPDIYGIIMGKIYAKSTAFKRMGLASWLTLGRGRRTGADHFFYIDKDKADEFSIESEYLRPLVKSPVEFRDIGPATSNLAPNKLVFLCHERLSALHNKGAIRYIQHGEEMGVNKRNLASVGGKWWDLGRQPVFDLILPIAFNDRFFLVHNDARFEVHQRFAVVKLEETQSNYLLPIVAWLNSTVVALMVEVLGRHSLGQGALDFPPEDWRQIIIPEPAVLGSEYLTSLEQSWTYFKEMPPAAIRDQINTPERKTLDGVVFDILRLSRDERDGVCDAVIELVDKRLRRAKSLTQK